MDQCSSANATTSSSNGSTCLTEQAPAHRGHAAQIPGQLSAASKRFKFSSTETCGCFEDNETALDWLEDARTVNLCRLCTNPHVGLRLNEDGQSQGARPRAREIDFLTTKGFADTAGKQRVRLVEVKSSKRYRTASLDDFEGRFPVRTGYQIVLHPKQLAVDGRQYLPLYTEHCA